MRPSGHCGTFLIFSDYMRPSLRLAALMRIPSIFVFTHDSIFLGEDGPTHQPIEQLDALRGIPNLAVWRPADGVETAMAWSWIARHTDGPSLLALSRQTVAALKREAPFQLDDVLRGAYCVQDPGRNRASCSSLPAPGLARVRAAGCAPSTPVRVVSMPCVSRFWRSRRPYRLQLTGRRHPVVPWGEPRQACAASSGRGLVCGIDPSGPPGRRAGGALRLHAPDAGRASISPGRRRLGAAAGPVLRSRPGRSAVAAGRRGASAGRIR
jgi:hypothetical protein